MSGFLKMSKPSAVEHQKLSMRGGALVLKTVARFSAGIRANKASSKAQTTASKQGKARKKMSDKDSMKCPIRVLEMAKKETLFSKTEVEKLFKIFKTLVTTNKAKSSKMNANSNVSAIMGKPTATQEGMDRTVFREILHNTFDILTEEMLMDRIFCVWDKENYNLISLESWLLGVNLFLRGTHAKKIEFCFAVYDLNVDGFITKDEMFQLLRNCLIKHPQEEDPDESVKDLVDIVMRKLDKDKDGKVSLKDFQETVAEEPLLLEAFGRCLPSEMAKDTFLSTLK